MKPLPFIIWISVTAGYMYYYAEWSLAILFFIIYWAYLEFVNAAEMPENFDI